MTRVERGVSQSGHVLPGELWGFGVRCCARGAMAQRPDDWSGLLLFFDGVIAAERNEGFSGSRGLGVEKWGSDNETNNHGFTLNM